MASSKDNSKATVEANLKEGKENSLQTAIAQIEKNFGKGSIILMGEKEADPTIKSVPTGSLALDIALGIGGVPRGRIVEIYGPESSGKTTLALHIVAEVQKQGGIAAFVDAEHALDPIYANNLGVKVNELYVSQPDDGEQALEIAETMVRSGAMDVVVIDSVAALTPRAEIDGEMGDSHVGLQARLMSQALRKLTPVTAKSNCVVIFINQLRDKIGVVYGNPETTTGGKALKYYASVRIDVRKAEVIKNGTELVGNRTKAKVVKNKVAPPFKLAEFDIMYGEGISHVGDVLDIAASLDIVKKGGAWYSYGEDRIGQGRETAKKFLKAHPAICYEIENKVRDFYGMPPVEVPPEVATESTDEATDEATSDINTEAVTEAVEE
jgi:recombination protein RecA